MISYKDVAYNQTCKLDMYFPEKEGFTTFVYFHGGGLESGAKDDPRVMILMERLVKYGFGFVSVEYRMYSKTEDTGVHFPDYLHDAADAVAYVKNNVGAYGGSGKMYVTGSSAGGWLAAMLCLNSKFLSKVGVHNDEIDAWIIDSAQMTSHFNVLKNEKGIDARREQIDEFAPLYYVDANTKFSKMLLLFYDNDMVCRLEQNLLFYRSVLRFNPNADIEYKCLTGRHCVGIHTENEKGELMYVQEVLDWLLKGER